MGRINVTSWIFEGLSEPQQYDLNEMLEALQESAWCPLLVTIIHTFKKKGCALKPLAAFNNDWKTVVCVIDVQLLLLQTVFSKLTWLVLGGDPAARSHRVEQFTALWGL